MAYNIDDYVQVNERIEKFYAKYPSGSIQTEIQSNENGVVIFKAYAYRDKEDTKPATGHAYEKEGSSFINKTSYIENCETSAVGRALAMLGFEIKKSIASREEVENAKLQQEVEEKIIDTTKVQAMSKFITDSKLDEKIVLGIIATYGYSNISEIKVKDYMAIANKLKQYVTLASKTLKEA